MQVVVASKSPIKLQAIGQRFNAIGIPSLAKLPAQPINSALECAHRRLNDMDPAPVLIAIENGIDTIDHEQQGGDLLHFVDVCAVVIQYQDQRYEGVSFGIPIQKAYVYQADKETQPNYCRDLGYQVTVGQLLEAKFHVEADNWMKDPRFGGIDRQVQILDALDQALATMPLDPHLPSDMRD